MHRKQDRTQSCVFHPLTLERWPDFERLMGPRGGYGGCWCMWWRETRSRFTELQGEGNRRAMLALVRGGEIPGIIAYVDGEPAGWCSIAPRENYPSLERSRVLKRLDALPVWSIVCFFIVKNHRGKGLAGRLIRAASEHAARNGGRIVEAYPTKPRGRRLQDVSSYMGVPSLFEQAGFTVCASPSADRLIMRYYIRRGGGGSAARRKNAHGEP